VECVSSKLVLSSGPRLMRVKTKLLSRTSWCPRKLFLGACALLPPVTQDLYTCYDSSTKITFRSMTLRCEIRHSTQIIFSFLTKYERTGTLCTKLWDFMRKIKTPRLSTLADIEKVIKKKSTNATSQTSYQIYLPTVIIDHLASILRSTHVF